VRELEKAVGEEFDGLLGSVKNSLKKAGGETKEQQEASLKRTQIAFRKDLAQGYEKLDPGKMIRPIFFCFYPWKATLVGHGHEVLPLGAPGGSVSFHATDPVAHPFAEAKGSGTGTTDTVQVKAWFDYVFEDPPFDRSYCLRPIMHLNGHWLLWTWGSCGGTAEDLGAGELKIVVRVRAGQNMVWVKEAERVVIDKASGSGGDSETGFYFDSEVSGGPTLFAYLQSGFDATIRVECDILTKITNHGRAWVNMQASPQFYFKVPEVYCGWPLLTHFPLIGF
jgi:hypothetical protein